MKQEETKRSERSRDFKGRNEGTKEIVKEKAERKRSTESQRRSTKVAEEE